MHTLHRRNKRKNRHATRTIEPSECLLLLEGIVADLKDILYIKLFVGRTTDPLLQTIANNKTPK